METKPCMNRCPRYASSHHHSHDSLMAEVGLMEEDESKTMSKPVGNVYLGNELTPI